MHVFQGGYSYDCMQREPMDENRLELLYPIQDRTFSVNELIKRFDASIGLTISIVNHEVYNRTVYVRKNQLNKYSRCSSITAVAPAI